MTWLPRVVLAGGSGLNVLVVVNPNSPDSLALGNYYCERRQVPPQNVVRMANWTGGNVLWTRSQLQSALLAPLLRELTQRGLDHQIDFVLLSMDIPYQVSEADSVNGTTSVLFYGFKPTTAFTVPGSCALALFSSNSYAFSEAPFRDQPPDPSFSHPLMAIMLTASSLPLAKLTVDQGVASDGTFPAAPVYLAKTSDTARSVRAALFDDAILDAHVLGRPSLLRTNQDSPYGLSGLLGYQTGLYQFSLLPGSFVPGAMADSLTSYGGVILQPNDHTNLLAFLEAGASGSYGTVVEPCANPNKFPSPRNYFYQARGFSLAESYYQSLCNPYQGLLVGEPLAAPFARRAVATWTNLPAGAVLRGTTNLALQFAASDPGRPLQQADLFLDGAFLQTITNISPNPNDRLWVAVNGSTVQYRVPANATLHSIATGFAEALNAASNSNHMTATACGDRITLRSTQPLVPGSQISTWAWASNALGAPQTTFVQLGRSDFVDSPALALGSFALKYASLGLGDWVQLDVTKTNGTVISVSVTNTTRGESSLGLARQLSDAVNTNQALMAADGVVASVIPADSFNFRFTLQACAPGLAPSQIEAFFRCSSAISWVPTGANRLESNLSETQPRNHLYLTGGTTYLPLVFPLDTTALPDGYHDLTVVAYEGSSVRAQTPITLPVVISNAPLAATLAPQPAGSPSPVTGTLEFSVSANANVARTELFSTGGSLGVVTNQVSASFSVAGTHLGVGLHPFYAVVTSATGAQYRTETKWIRLE